MFRKKFSIICLATAFFVMPFFSINAFESTSTSYIVDVYNFDAGEETNSENFSIIGDINSSQKGFFSSASLPLSVGTVTSCGKITSSGTYTLGANISYISGTCFTVLADNVTLDGAGYTVSGANGNASYAVVATSSTSNGGSAYNNLNIQNIIFNNFAYGVNANGNNGTLSGGAGGSVVISSSTLGSITANGGNASSGIGGAGGSISISGTDIDLAGKTLSVSGGTGSVNGSLGTITVSGSILVSNGQIWTLDDSLWQGTRAYEFTGDAYSSGTVTGTTTLMAYTASSSIVTIDGDLDFVGIGRVNGTLLDSQGENILTWNLINGSILTGSLSGDIVFNDTSKNAGVVFDDAVFNDYSYNEGTVLNATFTATTFNSANIPNADPTGHSDGHTVSGNILFSATTSPVSFVVNTGSTWSSNTFGWVFATSGESWTFNFSNNTGSLSGSATFNSAQNNGQVDGNSTFNSNSYNNGTTAYAYFYGNSYNIGTSAYAYFYNTSTNSYNLSAGAVSIECNFYDSSLPGIGQCPSGATYYHIPYYFTGAVSTHWGDIGNWFFDSSETEPTLVFPQNGDTVYIGTEMTSGPASAVALGSIIVASSTTGGGSFSVDFTNASGPAYFYDGSTNAGEVNGVFHIYGNRAFSDVNTTGTYAGNIAFHDSSYNDITINTDVTFYDTSYNALGAVVNGNAEFAGTNINNGTVVGVATVNAGASLSGSGTVENNSVNSGDISGGIFNGIVTNVSGAVTGAVTNLLRMIFNGGSYVSNTGQLSGDAEFNASSSNRGIVTGSSTFYDSSYNIGTTSVATFVGDLSENIYNGISGFVSGVKTRLYTSLAPQLNFFRDFTDSAWTIIADNTIVKLLYVNLVDIFDTDSPTETTLVEQNGGFIYRPLLPGNITSCGVLDTENGTYTLTSDISNYAFDICFNIRANGVTLDGAGHSVTAVSSSSSLYAVVSTSTLTVDATSSAFTNLTIKNIKFYNFAHGLFGRGTDVPDGIGGDGTDVSIDHTTIGNIDVSGGDPTEKGGDGGDVTLETVITNNIISRGGDSTACGIAGNGGNISITTDTVYATTTNSGGIVTGCPEDVIPEHGASGSIRTNIVSSDTVAAQTALNSIPTNEVSSGAKTPITDSWDFSEVYNFLLPVLKLSPINFPALPSFGDGTNKNSFSFLSSIDRFLFAPLPRNINQTILNILNSLGVKYEKELLELQKSPLIIKDTKNIEGLLYFSVPGLSRKSVGGEFLETSRIPVTSYIKYDIRNSLSQSIKVPPGTSIDIISNFNINNNVTFNGKNIMFLGNTASFVAPAKVGSYVLKIVESPVVFIVEVVDTRNNVILEEMGNTNMFTNFINWILNLFNKIFSFLR